MPVAAAFPGPVELTALDAAPQARQQRQISASHGVDRIRAPGAS